MQPILTVDLSSGNINKYTIPLEWEQQYLGGASLAARLLFADLVPELDPLSPQAPLLFLTGPLTGTAGPAVGRFVICGKSPATGLWGESNCGGFWGPELRMAGYDGLLVRGRSEVPVYLSITDKQVEIRPAASSWGLDTYSTQSKIQAESDGKKLRIACIGPAGEALIPFSLILCDHGRVAGRTGMGAVMGSKNLKAVAVKGSGRIPISGGERYLPLRSESNRSLREDPVSKVARELGTASVADYLNYLQELPKKYFTRGKFNDELQISGVNINNTILVGVSACHACVIACGRVVDLGDGEQRKGPEYETLAGFGPNLLVNDPVAISRMGELCDRYGMDSISLSNTIGLAFHLYDRGIIGIKDTGGLTLDWGNVDVIEKLIQLTWKKQGFGKLLALGGRELGRYYNVEDEAVQVNGLEVAYHDPRGATGMGLVYATSPRGACHNQSDYFLVEIGQCYPTLGLEYFSPRGGIEKAGNVARHQDWRTLFNSLVMCFFANTPPETLLELVNSACGYEFTLEQMLLIGERGWNLKRVINNRLGLNSSNDKLPKALLQPYEDDSEGFTPGFNDMLTAYYAHRKWDSKTGIPRKDKLLELGLDWTSNDVYGISDE
jgi:aldehyde:ferredoxin oxidoreductase